MDFDSFKNLVASSASVGQILQFLSGVLVCRQFIKSKTSTDVSALPFICGYTSCAIWASYGLTIHDDVVTFVNLLGTAMFFAYAVVLCVYTKRKSVVLRQMSGAIVFLVAVYALISSGNEETIKSHTGMVACVVTLMFFAAPLANLAHVIKTKSSETLPFPIILMSFVVTFLWTLYGYLNQDKFLVYPNLLGFLLSCFQLSLFALYPSR